jgi:amino acid transporter
MGAVNNSFAANFLLGQANLVFPSFTIERWHTVLVTYAVVAWSLAINVFAPHLLNRLSRAILIWNICSFMIITVTLLATNSNKQAPSFVFQDFQNFTGFGQAMATIIGILQSFFGMCCYDAPSHMTEEMKHPSRDAPIAMVLSVGMGSVTGFVFLLTLCFCIGDIDNTAASSTGVPVIQIFYDSTNSKVGACFMASMITVINLVCAVSLLAEGSRSLFAFARDNGLPFSKVLSKVTSKSHIPLNAIFATVLVQMAFNSIYFGTITGFNTILSIATTGFCTYTTQTPYFPSHILINVSNILKRYILCLSPLITPPRLYHQSSHDRIHRLLRTRPPSIFSPKCAGPLIPPFRIRDLQFSFSGTG